MAEFKGTREAFAAALIDLAAKDDKIMFVSPDSLKAMRATKFAELYPDQYVEVGISEQGCGGCRRRAGICRTGPICRAPMRVSDHECLRADEYLCRISEPECKVCGNQLRPVGRGEGGRYPSVLRGSGHSVQHPKLHDFDAGGRSQTYHAVKMAARLTGRCMYGQEAGRERMSMRKRAFWRRTASGY